MYEEVGKSSHKMSSCNVSHFCGRLAGNSEGFVAFTFLGLISTILRGGSYMGRYHYPLLIMHCLQKGPGPGPFWHFESLLCPYLYFRVLIFTILVSFTQIMSYLQALVLVYTVGKF